MQNVTVNTTIDIEVSEITKAMSPEEMGELFCDISEEMASKERSLSERRVLIGRIADGMHEQGITMMGEVIALAYQRAKKAMDSVSPVPFRSANLDKDDCSF